MHVRGAPAVLAVGALLLHYIHRRMSGAVREGPSPDLNSPPTRVSLPVLNPLDPCPLIS